MQGFFCFFSNTLGGRKRSGTGGMRVRRAAANDVETLNVPKPRRTGTGAIRSESFMFSQLFEEGTSKNEYITTFLAVLELLKLQLIDVKQEGQFEDFTIIKRPDTDHVEVTVEDEYESASEEEYEPFE